jgi:Flp pilus assembly protein TadD
LRVVLDRNLRGPLQFDQHAEIYARQGKWALALLHWRRAIGLQPRFAGYHKKLGNALAHLGRQQDALTAYNSGAELDPTDPELARLVDELKASMPAG